MPRKRKFDDKRKPYVAYQRIDIKYVQLIDNALVIRSLRIFLQ